MNCSLYELSVTISGVAGWIYLYPSDSGGTGLPAMVYHLRGYSLLQIQGIAGRRKKKYDLTSFLPDIRYRQGN
jgi:hypothetical protein